MSNVLESRLTRGRPFRILSADSTVRSPHTGDELITVTLEMLNDMVAVFNARISAGEGRPKIDYGHIPESGIYGRVYQLYVDSPDERPPGLYAVPQWTAAGVDLISRLGGESGLLFNSPEFIVSDRFLRTSGAPERIGGAELIGLALTTRPAQSEAVIDPVALQATQAKEAHLSKPKKLEVGDEHGLPTGDEQEQPEQTPEEARIEALEAENEALKAQVDELKAENEALKTENAQLRQDLGETEEEALQAREDEAIAQLFSLGLPRGKEGAARKAWRIEHDPSKAQVKAFMGADSLWLSLEAEAKATAKLTGSDFKGRSAAFTGPAKGPQSFSEALASFAAGKYNLSVPAEKTAALTAFGAAHPEAFITFGGK